MLIKFLKDKKIIIVAVIIVLVIIGIVILAIGRKGSQESEKQMNNIKTEQNQNDEPYDGDGLEVKEEDTQEIEQSVNAPSSWEDETDSKSTQSGQSNESDQQDQSDTTVEDDNKSEDEGNMSDEETPDDDKEATWGTIF